MRDGKRQRHNQRRLTNARGASDNVNANAHIVIKDIFEIFYPACAGMRLGSGEAERVLALLDLLNLRFFGSRGRFATRPAVVYRHAKDRAIGDRVRTINVALPFPPLGSRVEFFRLRGPFGPDPIPILAVGLQHQADVDPGRIIVRIHMLQGGSQVVKRLGCRNRDAAALYEAVVDGSPRLARDVAGQGAGPCRRCLADRRPPRCPTVISAGTECGGHANITVML